MNKRAFVMGAQRAMIDSGLLQSWGSMEKEAMAADVAAQATPDEAQMVGENITQQDLESMMKILEVLGALQQQYASQQQPPPQGGMPPMGPPMGGGMPPMGPPPQGGMPPMGPPMGGGMPPQGGMPPMGGGMPPGGGMPM